MEPQALDELIACLPRERTLFSYFEGRYAIVLLTMVASGGLSVRELRETPYGRLLDKPLVREALAMAGGGRLDPDQLDLAWPVDGTHDFLLGVTGWGTRDRDDQAWQQTSRRGANLVLQLNLNTGVMADFARLVPYANDYNCFGHPSSDPDEPGHRETLAWARLDVSLETDEVLVEEVQSDFVRRVRWNASMHEDHAAVMALCGPLERIWQEAMLTAVVQFATQELGVRTLYYHEFETGCALKRLGHGRPPRSIYEALPRRFCMTRTARSPALLQTDARTRRCLRRLPAPAFYSMDLGRSGHA